MSDPLIKSERHVSPSQPVKARRHVSHTSTRRPLARSPAQRLGSYFRNYPPGYGW